MAVCPPSPPLAPGIPTGAGGGPPPPPPCDTNLVSGGWCDQNGDPFDVIYTADCVSGAITIAYYDPNTGAVAAPVLPLQSCNTSTQFEQLALCDVDAVTGDVLGVYIARTVYDEITKVFTTTTISVDTGLPYVPAGVPRFCGDGIDVEEEIICVADVATPLVGRQVRLTNQYLAGSLIGSYVTELDSSITPLAGWGTTVLPSNRCVDGQTFHKTNCFLALTTTMDHDSSTIVNRDVIYDAMGNPLYTQWQSLATGLVFYTEDHSTGVTTGTAPILTDMQPCELIQPEDVELIPMCIVDNVTGALVRRVVQQRLYNFYGTLDGVTYTDAISGFVTVMPPGTRIDFCPDTPLIELDTEDTIWCVSNQQMIRRTTTNNVSGLVTSTVWLDTSGTPVNPQPSGVGLTDAHPGPCAISGNTTPACYTDPVTGLQIPFLGVGVIAYNGQFISGGTFNYDGTPLVVPAGAVIGPCNDCESSVQSTILCDISSDPLVPSVQFMRTMVRGCDGQMTGYVDTDVDGKNPYTVVGTIGQCLPALVPCGDESGVNDPPTGPITAGSVVAPTVATGLPYGSSFYTPGGIGNLPAGGTWTFPATNCGSPAFGVDEALSALKLPAVPRPFCDTGTVQVNVKVHYRNDGPDAGQASTGYMSMYYHTAANTVVLAGSASMPQNTPAFYEGDLIISANIPADRLAAGEVYVVIGAETWQHSFNRPSVCKAWTFSAYTASFAYNITGCPPPTIPAPNAMLVKICTTDPLPVVTTDKDHEFEVLCDVTPGGTVQFVRHYIVSPDDTVVARDTMLNGITPYATIGVVGLCAAQDCASTVQVVKLCDLNPATPPNLQNKRCATSFLRHMVYDCSGALVSSSDTTMDGTTAYFPVQVVDCGEGTPALGEVPWSVTSVIPDPASPVGRGFIYKLSPNDDPSIVGTVTVTTTSTFNANCPNAYSNPNTFTFTLDAVAQAEMTVFQANLIDFDSFERVSFPGIFTLPDRLGGTAYFDVPGGQPLTVLPTVNNGTGILYWDSPPAVLGYRSSNSGGGNSCGTLDFNAISLRPQGCCGCETEAPVDVVKSYVTTTQDVAAAGSFTILPVAGGQLVSWTARNRNATTATVKVNAGAALTMDVGESIGSTLSGHDANDALNDTVVITGGNGVVRLTIQRRV